MPFAASAVAVFALPLIEPCIVLLKVLVPLNVLLSVRSEDEAAVIVQFDPRVHVWLFTLVEGFVSPALFKVPVTEFEKLKFPPLFVIISLRERPLNESVDVDSVICPI